MIGQHRVTGEGGLFDSRFDSILVKSHIYKYFGIKTQDAKRRSNSIVLYLTQLFKGDKKVLINSDAIDYIERQLHVRMGGISEK